MICAMRGGEIGLYDGDISDGDTVLDGELAIGPRVCKGWENGRLRPANLYVMA